MKLANPNLLMICMISIQFLSLSVFANIEENSEDVSSEPFKAFGWDQFKATIQDSYSRIQDDLVKKKQMVSGVLANLQLPQMFDWNLYKRAFRKIYTNVREDLARQKLFFANALKIVAHNFGFKVGTVTHYLRVNKFADFTPAELKRIYMREDQLNDESTHSESENNCDKECDENRESYIQQQLGASLNESKDTFARVLMLEQQQNEGEKELQHSKSPAKGDETPKKNQLLGVTNGEKANENVENEQVDNEVREVEREPTPNENNESIDLADQASDHGDDEDRYQEKSDDNELESSKITTTVGDKNASDDLFEVPNDDKEDIIDELQVDSGPLVVQDENNQVYLDWRTSGCLFIPRDQGICSSCYAFAIIALMEWLHCRQTGQLIPFSEQYAVDCGNHVGMVGCSGGNPLRIGRFLMDWGVELREKYLYSGKDSSCPYEFDDWEHAGYKRPIINKYIEALELGKWPEILEKSGPILVQIRMPQDFPFYGGNVHMGDNCAFTADGFVHMMLVIGHGKEDGQDYWLLRNSHGSHWGERGYFKLSKHCNINCYYGAYEVLADFSNEGAHPYETLGQINGTKVRPSEALIKRRDAGEDVSDLYLLTLI